MHESSAPEQQKYHQDGYRLQYDGNVSHIVLEKYPKAMIRIAHAYIQGFEVLGIVDP